MGRYQLVFKPHQTSEPAYSRHVSDHSVGKGMLYYGVYQNFKPDIMSVESVNGLTNMF